MDTESATSSERLLLRGERRGAHARRLREAGRTGGHALHTGRSGKCFGGRVHELDAVEPRSVMCLRMASQLLGSGISRKL